MRGINMETADGRINLSSTLPMQGVEARDSLTAEIIEIPPALRFCSEYLQQALGNITTASIEMHFLNELSPMLIMPHGTDFPQAVIMPMRGN
jgi:DNA polymerase III sliding clamp (beta) subunit (PCNA family)